MSVYRCVCLAAAICAAGPAAAVAQTAGANAAPLGYVTTPYSFELSDGEPISWFLEFSQPLKLTPEQKTTLISIRRRLRNDNEHFMQRLDSVARAVGLTLGERVRMSGDERAAVERFNKATQRTRDSIKTNNDLARAEVLTLLTTTQQTRLDSLLARIQRERGRGILRRGQGAGGA